MYNGNNRRVKQHTRPYGAIERRRSIPRYVYPESSAASRTERIIDTAAGVVVGETAFHVGKAVIEGAVEMAGSLLSGAADIFTGGDGDSGGGGADSGFGGGDD